MQTPTVRETVLSIPEEWNLNKDRIKIIGTTPTGKGLVVSFWEDGVCAIYNTEKKNWRRIDDNYIHDIVWGEQTHTVVRLNREAYREDASPITEVDYTAENAVLSENGELKVGDKVASYRCCIDDTVEFDPVNRRVLRRGPSSFSRDFTPAIFETPFGPAPRSTKVFSCVGGRRLQHLFAVSGFHGMTAFCAYGTRTVIVTIPGSGDARSSTVVIPADGDVRRLRWTGNKDEWLVTNCFAVNPVTSETKKIIAAPVAEVSPCLRFAFVHFGEHIQVQETATGGYFAHFICESTAMWDRFSPFPRLITASGGCIRFFCF